MLVSFCYMSHSVNDFSVQKARISSYKESRKTRQKAVLAVALNIHAIIKAQESETSYTQITQYSYYRNKIGISGHGTEQYYF